MRLRGKKAIFNYDDTFSLDSVLSPIIGAGLIKFLEVLKTQRADPSDSFFGIPSGYVEQVDDEDETDSNYDVRFNEGTDKWFCVLESMIYAFTAEEPELGAGVLEMISPSVPDDRGLYPVEIVIHDQTAYDKHEREREEHERKVKDGLNLFSEHYNNLWW